MALSDIEITSRKARTLSPLPLGM